MRVSPLQAATSRRWQDGGSATSPQASPGGSGNIHRRVQAKPTATDMSEKSAHHGSHRKKTVCASLPGKKATHSSRPATGPGEQASPNSTSIHYFLTRLGGLVLNIVS